MRAWALWSSRVDPFSHHELVEVFAQQEDAEAARAALIGKPREWLHNQQQWDYLFGVWADDEDFPDLYVRPIEIR